MRRAVPMPVPRAAGSAPECRQVQRCAHVPRRTRTPASDVELNVRSGAGFDPERAINGHGLELTSMDERLNLSDGRLAIDFETRTRNNAAGVGVTPTGDIAANPNSHAAGRQSCR